MHRYKVLNVLAPLLIFALVAGMPLAVGAEFSKDMENDCLELIAVLPVMADQGMQELGNDNRVYAEGGYLLLVRKIQSLAEESNADALYSLGVLHESGYCGQSKDAEKALSFYKEAATRGSRQAKERLGI
jgi:TPR repeat protein